MVTSTTHKTLRGPRGGVILSQEQYAKKLNSAIFPGSQGGPLEHVIAGKAIAFGEALQPEFKVYAAQVIKNAQAMADVFNHTEDIRVVAGGTDNHLFNLDLTKTGLNGKQTQELLDSVSITTNKEALPNETLSPFVTSGIRIGTPAMTTRGFNEADARQVAELIVTAIHNHDDPKVLKEVKKDTEILAMTHLFE